MSGTSYSISYISGLDLERERRRGACVLSCHWVWHNTFDSWHGCRSNDQNATRITKHINYDLICKTTTNALMYEAAQEEEAWRLKNSWNLLLNLTHCSTGGILDGDCEPSWVSTLGKNVLTCCREGEEPSVKGLEIHVPSNRALSWGKKDQYFSCLFK